MNPRIWKYALLLVSIVGLALPAAAWDRVRHDAIASIAEQHLTRRAKRNIARYLEHSIVYYASYMDKHRDDPGFCHIEHVSYVDGQMQLVDTLRDGKMNCVVALMQACDRLRNYREMDDSLVRLNLMYVIHIAGDMHCPGHVYYPGQSNSFKVRFGGREVSYHSVWDDGFIGSIHKWSYMEYNHQLGNLDRKEAAAIVAGTPVDWERENARNCKVIYDWAAPGAVLGDDFKLAAWSLADSQIQKAGYRLASVLNAIFK